MRQLKLHIKRLARRVGGPVRDQVQPGQGLVELALVGMLLAFTGLGMMEMGRAFHSSLTASHAARDGVRVGSNPEISEAQIQAAVAEAAKPLTPSTVVISRTATDISVTVTFQFQATAPLVSELWGGGPLTISRTMAGRMEEE